MTRCTLENEGSNGYVARITATSWRYSGEEFKWEGRGLSLQAALQTLDARLRVITDWKGSRYRNVGRKPKPYWAATDALRFLRSIQQPPTVAERTA